MLNKILYAYFCFYLLLNAQPLHSQNEVKEWHIPAVNDYIFLNKQINTFQFYESDALKPFFKNLDSSTTKRITVLHIGDSHVQADIFTGCIRSLLQTNLGLGGRGLVFPYSTARTHTAIDYFSYHTGIWTSARNIEANPGLSLGMTGVSASTYSAASTFRLSFKQPLPESYTAIKVFCKTDESSFNMFVTSATAVGDTLWLKTNLAENQGIVVGNLPMAWQHLQFGFKISDSLQTQFELYGLSIENAEPGGIIYHSAGINGATHLSILRQNLMKIELAAMNPDLVYFDLGGNDFYFESMNENTFRNNLEKIIQRIRTAVPNVPIILSSTQDMCRGGYSVGDCDKFSRIIKEVAKQFHCAFYDYFWVAGGPKAMHRWYNSGLAKNDLVHLSSDGYTLKGTLIAQAYYNTYKWYKTSDTGHLVHNIDTLLNPPIDTSRGIQQQSPLPVVPNWIIHKVKSGESLYSIATKYGVTIYQIKAWNGLRNNFIYKNLEIKIYSSLKKTNHYPKLNPATGNKPVYKPTKPKPVAASTVYHKVKKGETLYVIALKYRTSVAQIKRTNGLRSSNLAIGKVLRIR